VIVRAGATRPLDAIGVVRTFVLTFTIGRSVVDRRRGDGGTFGFLYCAVMSVPGVRAVVVDDSLISRAGLVALLEQIGGVEVVAQAEDLRDAVEVIGATDVDLVVTDLRMPPGHHDEGVQLARALAGRQPVLPVIVLSQHCEPDLAAQLFARGAKGRGYLLKERVADIRTLERAIGEVMAGGTVIDRSVVAGMVVDRRGTGDPRIGALTPREAQVLELLASGQSNTAIARTLGVARRAVESNVNRIFSKLELRDDDDLAPRVAATLAWLEARPK
jgi:DNA-binding NarL/FixJ family response regulator